MIESKNLVKAAKVGRNSMTAWPSHRLAHRTRFFGWPMIGAGCAQIFNMNGKRA
jgi:hypothetical protein